jgi:hypothetical protein
MAIKLPQRIEGKTTTQLPMDLPGGVPGSSNGVVADQRQREPSETRPLRTP